MAKYKFKDVFKKALKESYNADHNRDYKYNKRLYRSQVMHDALANTNFDIERAHGKRDIRRKDYQGIGVYHNKCHQEQAILGRMLSKEEKKAIYKEVFF